jgi:transcriptional regulator with XRE-family HTH domain
MTIGEKVKAAREEKRLSQKALADKIGLSEYTVIRLEKGRREPRPSELEKIAEVLGVPVASLYDAVPMKSDVTPLPMPTGKQIPVPLLSPEVTACCGDGIPTYDEIQNSPEKVMMFSISDLGGVYDEMRPPYAVRADGACLEKSRIFDGDILIFNPAAEPRQGQICIVCWGGALSAKKVVRHGDGSITLYSDADEFHLSPQEAGDPDRFSIWGPVVKSVVNFR